MGWDWFIPTERYTERCMKGVRCLTVAFDLAPRLYIALCNSRRHVYSLPGYWKAQVNGRPTSSCQRHSFWVFFHPLIILQSYSLPGDFMLTMTYGYEVRGLDDRNLTVARKMAKQVTVTALPSALLVNDLPFRAFSLLGYGHRRGRPRRPLLVRHIFEWLLWFSYKPLARFGHDLGDEVLNEPIRFVRDSMVNVTYCPPAT